MKLAVFMSVLFLCMNSEIISLCVLCGWMFYAVGVLMWKAGEKGY